MEDRSRGLGTALASNRKSSHNVEKDGCPGDTVSDQASVYNRALLAAGNACAQFIASHHYNLIPDHARSTILAQARANAAMAYFVAIDMGETVPSAATISNELYAATIAEAITKKFVAEDEADRMLAARGQEFFSALLPP
jgi:hypothetical protein